MTEQMRGRALVATVRLLFCDWKVMGSSRDNSLFAKSKGKAAYNKQPSQSGEPCALGILFMTEQMTQGIKTENIVCMGNPLSAKQINSSLASHLRLRF